MAKKILVVDDEELIIKSLFKLLSIEGYDATVVRSGKEAIARVKENDFDLIICDVRMPEMNGVETIKHIRAHLEASSKKPVPEVLITGYIDADNDCYEAAMELKVVDYLYKPFDREDFLKIVKRSIG